MSKMKKFNSTLKDKFIIGQYLEVEVKEPNVGKFPIGILNPGRIVCLFRKTSKHLDIGSIVKVKVEQIKERNLEVSFIKLVKSKEEVSSEYADKLEELKECGFKISSLKQHD